MDATMMRNGWYEGASTAVRYAIEVADIIGDEAAGICRIMTEYADSVHSMAMKATRAWLDATVRFREELREGAMGALGATDEAMGKKAAVGVDKKA